MNGKTTHIIPKNRGWVVKSAEGIPSTIYATQGEAISEARRLAHRQSAGQVVLIGRNGSIRSIDTFGLPKVQSPSHKSSLGRKAIEKAVSVVVLNRLGENP